MGNWHDRTIDKEVFCQIMENISPSAYILCAKCRTTKIDAIELLKVLEKIIDQYYSQGDGDLAFELSVFLRDILELEPDDLDQTNLSKWYIKNKKRLYDRNEWGRLQYLVYDTVLFYQNVECGCYLKKSIGQKSVYSVRVE